MLSRIAHLISTADSHTSPLRTSELFNETWMLRLTLDYLSNIAVDGHPLGFSPRFNWFSEALLPSQFLPRKRGDNLSEGWTSADGVVGHFLNPNQTASGELRLCDYAKQFVVIESKMFSGLSSRVTNFAGYDQAARTVACMATVLSRGNICPKLIDQLAFYVIAPQSQIDLGVFGVRVTKESICERVTERTNAYGGLHTCWYYEWFLPTLDHVNIRLLAWEDVLAQLTDELKMFYAMCLR